MAWEEIISIFALVWKLLIRPRKEETAAAAVVRTLEDVSPLNWCFRVNPVRLHELGTEAGAM